MPKELKVVPRRELETKPAEFYGTVPMLVGGDSSIANLYLIN